jgi:chromatin remodeling complex protein RSC6
MAKAKTTQTSNNTASTEQVVSPAPAAQETAPAKAVKRVVKKAESAPAEQVATPAPSATPAVQEAAPAKSTKRSASKKAESAPAEQVASPAPASSNEQEHTATETVSIEERINQLVALNEQFTTVQKELSVLLKRAQKLHTREAKEFAIAASRNQARRARAAGAEGERAKRSGFSATPTLLSDSICTFLNLPIGSRLPRTDVNKLVTAYIKTNKLENPANRRSFVPDNKLQTLLGPLQDKHKEGGYSYFNIQTYLAQHFLKTDKQQTVAASQ